MKKNCERYRPALEAFIEGELSPGQAEELEQHLASCPECEAEREKTAADLAVFSAAVRESFLGSAESVDFERLWSGISAGISKPEIHETPADEPVKEAAPSHGGLVGLFVRHRPLWLSLLGGVALLILLLIPLLAGGGDPNHCVVDDGKVGGEGGHMAVLRARNKATGQKMTVILLNEPQTAAAEDDEEDGEEGS